MGLSYKTWQAGTFGKYFKKTSFQKEFIIGVCAALNFESTGFMALNFVVFYVYVL